MVVSRDDAVIQVHSDKPKYAPGQFIRLFGNITYLNGSAVDTIVELETKKTHNIGPLSFFYGYDRVPENESKPLDEVLLAPKNGSFSHTVSNLGSGKYVVTATGSVNGSNQTGWTSFEVINWTYSITFFVLVLTLVAFAGLVFIIVLFKEEKSYNSELARFMSISGIALLPISAFFLTDVEFGSNSIAQTQ